MLPLPVQEYLFQRIREKLASESSLVDTIASLLYVSNDSAYRRIRNETPLVLEEAKILCEAYNLSLDQLFNVNEKSVLFSVVQLDNANYTFEKYLQGILNDLQMVAAFDQKQIIYLTKDIAFFHYFCFRPLFAFRYFFWMKSILQLPEFVGLKFSMDYLTPSMEDMGRQITRAYYSIPSIEIWNTECVNSYIGQIEYYREAGYFKSDEDIDLIYSALSDTISHIKAQAEAGSKFLPGENPRSKRNNFEFYYNRIMLGDNTILAMVDGRKILYLNYDVLNYMSTQDEKFCNDVHMKLLSLMKRATILSNVSEKQRNIFFNILQKKIPQHISSNALE